MCRGRVFEVELWGYSYGGIVIEVELYGYNFRIVIWVDCEGIFIGEYV